MRILFFIILITLAYPTIAAHKADSLLQVLKSELSKQKHYDQITVNRIENLKRTFHQIPNTAYTTKYNTASQIFEAYKAFQFDSAHVYAQEMIDLSKKENDLLRLTESRIKLGTILIPSGMFKEAFDNLNEIEERSLPDTIKSNYYLFKARAYADLAKYDSDKFYAEYYRTEADKYFHLSASIIPSNDFENKISLAEIPGTSSIKKPSANYFYELITHHNLTNHGIAMVAMRLSYSFSGSDRLMFLALAAISDIRSSTKDTQAILQLGKELYLEGNLKDAYICVQGAIDDAQFYGARGHKMDIEAILPLIAQKKIASAEHEKDQLLIWFLIFSIIAIIILFVLFIVFIQLKKLKISEGIVKQQNEELANANRKLLEYARINEEYISSFFKSAFSHLTMLDKLKRTIERKLKMKKYDEAIQTLEMVKINKERESLYKTLDQIFLKLFPNFVTAFNSLLKEEDQIWPKENEVLSTNLRIFALIRLGINNNESIANILDYTVSTIYTYKIRIKSKALVQGDEFDSRIMSIKLVDV
jgi:hypothetical protein